MRGFPAWLVVGACLVTQLTGCAEGTEGYCSAVRSGGGELARLAADADQRRGEVVARSLVIFRDLRERAPGDVTEEWDAVVFAWEGLDDALRAAGLTSAEDRAGAPPVDLSPGEQRLIEQAAEQLGSPGVRAAAQGLQAHALDVCKVDLGLGTRPGSR